MGQSKSESIKSPAMSKPNWLSNYLIQVGHVTLISVK